METAQAMAFNEGDHVVFQAGKIVASGSHQGSRCLSIVSLSAKQQQCAAIRCAPPEGTGGNREEPKAKRQQPRAGFYVLNYPFHNRPPNDTMLFSKEYVGYLA